MALLPGTGTLKKVFTLGAIGTVATAGGFLLAPFFAASAGGAAVAAGATHGSVLGSFWAPLVTSTTGEVGLTAGLSKMGSGVVALAKSGFTVGASGVSAIASGTSPLTAMGATLSSPV